MTPVSDTAVVKTANDAACALLGHLRAISPPGSDLTVRQLHVLASIRDGDSNGALALRCKLAGSVVTRATTKLKTFGLVNNSVSEADQRKNTLIVTARGRKLVERIGSLASESITIPKPSAIIRSETGGPRGAQASGHRPSIANDKPIVGPVASHRRGRSYADSPAAIHDAASKETRTAPAGAPAP